MQSETAGHFSITFHGRLLDRKDDNSLERLGNVTLCSAVIVLSFFSLLV